MAPLNLSSTVEETKEIFSKNFNTTSDDVLILENHHHTHQGILNEQQFIEGDIENSAVKNNFNIRETIKGTERNSHKRIKDFYANSIIFITGATGFLGKALIEKLLRTCDEIQAIYILVRPKKGNSTEQRYKNFINHKVFDRLRAEKPTALLKLKCITGDITEPNLGLCEGDLKFIMETINIVFHSAATVKFNEGLKEAIEFNALSTERLMNLCSKMHNLKSVVHVSTAFCNPNRKYVNEEVYPSLCSMDKNSLMKCTKLLPSDILKMISEKIQGFHPNTYTLTKSIAEQIVLEYGNLFPVAIIRPSIVTGAIEEPFPGWVDNTQGITGIMMEIGRGTISSIVADENLVCDIIPLDTVVNTMIAAAWSIGITNVKTCKVYNCTSGQIKPISWKSLGKYTVKWARRNPSKYVTLYPKFSYRKNEFTHSLYEIFLHLLPAVIFDFFLKLNGTKPMMLKIAKKLQSACQAGKFFALREWTFENRNQITLTEEIKNTEDGKLFDTDIRRINYDDYIRNFMLGIRRFVLRDEDDSLIKARKKLKRIYWIRCSLQILLLTFILSFVFNYVYSM